MIHVALNLFGRKILPQNQTYAKVSHIFAQNIIFFPLRVAIATERDVFLRGAGGGGENQPPFCPVAIIVPRGQNRLLTAAVCI